MTSVPPGTFAFGISKAALGLIANGKVVQFRLTVRYPDGSYFTNFNDMYVVWGEALSGHALATPS